MSKYEAELKRIEGMKVRGLNRRAPPFHDNAPRLFPRGPRHGRAAERRCRPAAHRGSCPRRAHVGPGAKTADTLSAQWSTVPRYRHENRHHRHHDTDCFLIPYSQEKKLNRRAHVYAELQVQARAARVDDAPRGPSNRHPRSRPALRQRRSSSMVHSHCCKYEHLATTGGQGP